MQAPIRILAVDDDPINLEIVAEIIRDQCEVVFATSGEQALKRVAQINPDIVLLDVMMTNMDGFEVCRSIRQLEHIGSPAIIMVTARAFACDIETAKEAGADDFISKPFRHDELRKLILRWIAVPRDLRPKLQTSEVSGLAQHECERVVL